MKESGIILKMKLLDCMNDRFRNTIYTLVFSIILVIFSFITVININNGNVGYSEEFFQTNIVSEELHRNKEKKQKIYSEMNNLSGIKIKFGTYKRKNTDIIVFELYDSITNKRIRKKTIKTNKLIDNADYNIEFKAIKNSKDKDYYFKLKSLNGTAGNSITIYMKDESTILYDLGYIGLEKGTNALYFIIPIILFSTVLLVFFINKKKIKWFSFILILIILVEFMFLLNKINLNIEYPKEFYEGIEVQNTIGGLHNFDKKINKTFVYSNKEYFSGVRMKFATYKKKNTDDILFKLYDFNTNKEIRRIRLNSSNFTDNEIYNIEFKPIKNSKNKKYYFKIFSLNGNDENTSTIYSNKDNIIAYDLGYTNKSENIILYFLVSLVILIVFFTVFLFIRKKNIKEEFVFLILASIYGFFLLIIFPPLQTPDEDFHFLRAYAISTGQISTKKRGKNENVSNIPNAILEFLDRVKVEKIKHNYNEKIELDDLIVTSRIKLDNKKTEVDLGGTAIINPLSYIFQVIGIIIARFLKFRILFIYYFGKLLSFIGFLGVTYFSIKQAPKKIKKLLLIVALLPISMQQSISYSTDGAINAFSLLFVSVLFRLYLDKNIKFNFKHFILLFLGIFIPTTAKIVYILFVLLLFGLDSKKFKNKYVYFGMIFVIFVLTIVVNIGWSILSPENPVSPKGQIIYLSNNLFDYIGVIYLTTKEMSQVYIESLFGSLGWLDMRLPYLIIYGYIFIILCNLLSSIILKKGYKMKIIMIIYILGTYTGILTALYIAWTKPGWKYVDGVQGRYFLPILPILFILFSTKILKINKKKLEINTYIFLSFGLAYTVFTLIYRYYLI